MERVRLIDRLVVEIRTTDKPCPTDIANQLRLIAMEIEDGYVGRNRTYQNGSECLWQHESPEHGGFRMGDKSIIAENYYGQKEFWEVSVVSKEDIEKQGFDASKLTDEDMTRIASKQDDLMKEGCDYWTALDGSCEYWQIPRKED